MFAGRVPDGDDSAGDDPIADRDDGPDEPLARVVEDVGEVAVDDASPGDPAPLTRTARAGSAHLHAVRTVDTVTTPASSIHQREQSRLVQTRLGRIAWMATDAGTATGRARRGVPARLPNPSPRRVEPVQVATRRPSPRRSARLGRRRARCDGWALLTQRPEQRGAGLGRLNVIA